MHTLITIHKYVQRMVIQQNHKNTNKTHTYTLLFGSKFAHANFSMIRMYSLNLNAVDCWWFYDSWFCTPHFPMWKLLRMLKWNSTISIANGLVCLFVCVFFYMYSFHSSTTASRTEIFMIENLESLNSCDTGVSA